MLSVPVNVKTELTLYKLLICLSVLDHLRACFICLCLPAHSNEPIAECNAITHLRMNIWLSKEMNFREGNNTIELISLVR